MKTDKKQWLKEIDIEIKKLHDNFVDNNNLRQGLKNHYSNEIIKPNIDQLDYAKYELEKLINTLNIWEQNIVSMDDMEWEFTKYQEYKDFFSEEELNRLKKLKLNCLKNTDNEELLQDYQEKLIDTLVNNIEKYIQNKFPSISVDIYFDDYSDYESKWAFNIDVYNFELIDINEKKQMLGQNDLEYNNFVSSMIDQIPIITNASYSSFDRSIYLNDGTIKISNHLKSDELVDELLTNRINNLGDYGYDGVVNLIYNDKFNTSKELELLQKIFKEKKGGVKEFLLQQEKNDLQKEMNIMTNNEHNDFEQNVEEQEEEISSM